MSASEVVDRIDGMDAALSLFAMGHGIVDPRGLKCLENCSRRVSLPSTDVDQAGVAADDAPRASGPSDGVVRETGGRPPPKKRLAQATAAAVAAAESKPTQPAAVPSLADATAAVAAVERLVKVTAAAAADSRHPAAASHEEISGAVQAPPPPHPLGAVQADPERQPGYVSYEEMRRRAAREVGVPLPVGPRANKPRRKTAKPSQPKHVSYEEMKRLMRVYGPAKCLRNRSLPGRTEKPPSVRRKFYRWFPDFKERFELNPEGFYTPKIGHEEELRRREESRAWDQALLAAKRNAGRWQEKESKAIDQALTALKNK